MPNRELLYLIMYALMAKDGREAALFGDCAPLAREAFARSLAGEAFPILWFELPLMGDPWFDLHVLAVRDQMSASMRFSEDETAGHPEIFSWFVKEKHALAVNQLALSYDVSAGDIQNPAVQLLVRSRDVDVTCEFLEVAGAADLVAAYRDFAARIPQDWFACYAGVFPGRVGMGLRVECIPNRERCMAYAQNSELLARDLRAAGLQSISDTLLEYCAQLAPYRLEFQFNVGADGVVGPTFGTSVHCERFDERTRVLKYVPEEEPAAIFGMVQKWGLADERWHLVDELAFSKRVARNDDEQLLYCYPSMVKLRWHDGQPMDAKLYITAGVDAPAENAEDGADVSAATSKKAEEQA